jgi:hypothetical protein
VNREPNFDELIGAEASGAERERLLHAHELLLQAGPPPELPPSLRKAPSFGGGRVFRLQQRRGVKRRALVLIAAAVSVGAVFAAGYGVADNRGGHGTATPLPATILALKGTAVAPKGARATLEVWHSRDGNWPMTLSVVGLAKLPRHTYYEVYLVRNGRPWGLCGTFRVAGSSRPLILTLNAPYSLQKGDSWIVTRPGAGGSEPGRTVLRPVSV